MVCKDGFTLSLFCTSSDLRDLFSKSRHKLPNSPNTIRSIVTNFANIVRADMIIEFEHLKKLEQRFSLTFDEWTSQKNHRYLNVNVHQKENHFNLGLVRLHGSGTAEHCISLVKERLASFSLNLDTDIIASTTDGASVMVKVGRLLRCSQQLCFTHGLQLVVVDTLYKKVSEPVSECTATAIITESDIDGNDDTDQTEQGVMVNVDSPSVEMISTYDDLVKKVRKVIKIFKWSPTKNDIFLQKYVKEQEGLGKEVDLILDCRTRWNSLLNMLERFYNLKNYTTFRFILDKLQKQDTVLSNQLSKSLRERIQERRTELTGVLIYLQNLEKYDQETKNTDHTFFVPKKAAIRQEIIRILERVIGVGDN
ncbi:hypothetical protein ILUMI_15903, partial [Ignelater luminosus]